MELTFAHFNLLGVSKTVEFILSWRPADVIYRIARPFIRRLIDSGNFRAIDEILLIGSESQYLIIATTYELLEVGRIPNKESLEKCLSLFTSEQTRILKPGYSYNDTISSALISFTEACAAKKLPSEKIIDVFTHYFPIRGLRFTSSNYQYKDRETYLRSVALKTVLTGNLEPNLDELLPEKYEKEKDYDYERDISEFKAIVGGLLPWYIVRTRILMDDIDDIFEAIKDSEFNAQKAFVHIVGVNSTS